METLCIVQIAYRNVYIARMSYVLAFKWIWLAFKDANLDNDLTQVGMHDIYRSWYWLNIVEYACWLKCKMTCICDVCLHLFNKGMYISRFLNYDMVTIYPYFQQIKLLLWELSNNVVLCLKFAVNHDNTFCSENE